jgi:hypothetical protein
MVPQGTPYSYISKTFSSLHNLVIFEKYFFWIYGVVHALILFLSYAFYYILLLLLIFIIKRLRIINSSVQTYLGLLWYSWKENEVDSEFLLVQMCIRSANKTGVSGAPVAGDRTTREDRSDRHVLYGERLDHPYPPERSGQTDWCIISFAYPSIFILLNL